MINHTVFTGTAGMPEIFFAGTASRGKTFSEEITALLQEYADAMAQTGCSPESEVLLRFHVSDPANQYPVLKKALAGRLGGFVSVIGQPPASGARVALEAWHWQQITEKNKQRSRNALNVQLKNDGVAVFYSLEDMPAGNSGTHTGAEFESLAAYLMQFGGRVARNTVRTWLYCRDVDNQYAGLVKSRNIFFDRIGLRRDTRYIASTGIEGKMTDPNRIVKMDSLSIIGLNERHQRPVTAHDMLPPTHVYGVAFERGMQIFWHDREWCFISGTASIDKDGHVMHPGDVEKQTERMLENITTLLANANMTWENVMTGTVYLRDGADAAVVEEVLQAKLPATLPRIMVNASVCRPGWLVEMECFGIRSQPHSDGLRLEV